MIILRRTLLLLTGFLGSILAAGMLMGRAHTVCTLERPLEFPAELGQITALGMVCYEGLWQGSELAEGACILICNNTDSYLQTLRITLQTGDMPLEFHADWVPDGARLLILEQQHRAYTGQPILGYRVETEPFVPEFIRDIRIEETGMGTLQVTNCSNRSLKNLSLYHKGYLEQLQALSGGGTYRTPIGTLEPGQSVSVAPAGYARGYSRVLGVG